MSEVTRSSTGPAFKRYVGEDGNWYIEGYASTPAVDSYNEIIEQEAFREGMPSYEKFPNILLNHAWNGLPIGKMVEWKIDGVGLWMKVMISKTAANVWQLIEEEILKAFSVGWGNGVRDDSVSPPRWKKINLLEVSVVNLPANREALFAIAKGRGLDISQFTDPQSHNTKTGGSGMSELTLEQVKTVAGETAQKAVTDSTGTLLAAANENAKTAASAVEQRIEVKLGAIQTELLAVRDAAKGMTDAEFKAMVEKAVPGLSPMIAKAQRESATGLSTEGAQAFYDMRTAPLKRSEIEIANEQRMSPAHVRAMIYKPSDVFPDANGFRAQAMKNFHDASDMLYFVDILVRQTNPNYGGPKHLKFYQQVYLPALREFQRAMDTATTSEGTEWVPTMMTASFLEIFELQRQVAAQFETFAMPSKVYDWPVQSGTGTAYLPGESTSDSATNISASTPGTRKTTFTAKKLAARFLTSTEWVEDAAIEAMSFLRTELAATLARGEEDAIINGDTAATHQDSNVTASDDRRKAWLGLRAWCHDQSNTTDQNAAITTAGYLASRKSMGKYAVNPKDCCHITDPVTYLTTVALAECQTYDKFGPLATIFNGALAAIGGIALFQSEFVPVNLNASGVYDGSTTDNTVVLTVHKPSWKIGTRRQVTVKVDDKIATDQFELVGTMREDFQPMRATDQDIAWERYNVTYP